MRMRLYSLHEIRQLVNAAGWTFLNSCGDIKSLDEVSLNSKFLVTISQKTKDINC